jgi:hypothetical protein
MCTEEFNSSKVSLYATTSGRTEVQGLLSHTQEQGT